MSRVLLLITLALLTACNKYGPSEAPEGATAPPPAGATTEASQAPPQQWIASPYTLPEGKYTMRCDLNSVGGVGLEVNVPGKVVRSAQVIFNGWAINENLAGVGSFLIVLEGASTYAIPTTTDLDRPDVAQGLGSQDALKSGFGFLADISQVPAGEYAVYFFEPKAGAACDTGKKLSLSES